jgi:hypothetical protein
MPTCGKWRCLLLVFGMALASPQAAHAAGLLSIKGTVFSILQEEFVIQSGRELFHLKKKALPQEQRAILEKAGAHEITVDVPFDAITRVRSGRPETKSPAH